MAAVWGRPRESQVFSRHSRAPKAFCSKCSILSLILLSASTVLSIPVQPDYALANLPIEPWVQLEANVLQLPPRRRHEQERPPAWMTLRKRQDSSSSAGSIVEASSTGTAQSTD